jgi:NTP pyrophosphatase (non-canonical NTP hydrolase)
MPVSGCENAWNKYQEQAATTACYPTRHGIEYTALGLAGEAGEVANKVKKYLRGDYGREELRAACFDELSDVLWYVAMLAKELDLELESIAAHNLEKLADRQRRGVIKGSGDDR